jgi:hypothetical protein
MFTTAMHLPDEQDHRWNELASPQFAPWLLIAFTEQLTEYLARTTDLDFNILAGEPVTLPVPPSDGEREYLLRKPEFAQSRKTVPAGQSTMIIDETRELGQYELAAVGQEMPVAGFSVNASPAESDFTRLSPEQLEELFGKGKYQVARTLDEIKTAVNVADLGKEVFPLVLCLAILAFFGEHFVANWFYDDDGGAPSGRPSPSRGGDTGRIAAPPPSRASEPAGVST